MKKNKKLFSQSLRTLVREGFLLYAASTNCFPMNADLIELYQQTIDKEAN